MPDLELLRKLAPPVEEPPPARFAVPARRRRPVLLLTPVAVGVAVLALVLTQLGGGQTFAAAAIRAAEASPRLLVEGWEVTRVDEWDAGQGEMLFSGEGRTLDLQWGLDAHTKEGLEPVTTTRVAGDRARVYRYPGSNDFVARWGAVGARGVAPSADAFVATLHKLERVDAEEWLRALPGSAVTPRAQAGTVQEMLRGIPLPPGFKPPAIGGTTRDRYQLGAKVAGAVACAWIERGGQEARAALASSRNWPVLLEMNAEGDYPEVVWLYADALNGKGDVPAGKLGLTVDGTYKDALGC